MHTVHRIYIGARNTDLRKFAPHDENRINDILGQYLFGWTITMGVGCWDGTLEETMILTVVQSPGNTRSYGNKGLVSAVKEIAALLQQYAVMWESNGKAVLVPTAAAAAVPCQLAAPAPAAPAPAASP